MQILKIFKIKMSLKLLFSMAFFNIIYFCNAQNIQTEKLEFLHQSKNFSLEKPIVLKFFATWCLPCIAEIPKYNNLVNLYQDSLTFLTITNQDINQRNKDFINRLNLAGDFAFDVEGFHHQLYSIQAIPEYLIIYKNNIIFKGNLDLLSQQFNGDTSLYHYEKNYTSKYNEIKDGFKLEILGPKAKHKGSKITIENKGGKMKAGYYNIQISDLIGTQIYDFPQHRVILDTNEFYVNFEVNVNFEGHWLEFKNIINYFLFDKLNFSIDTVYKLGNVVEVLGYNGKESLNPKGWTIGENIHFNGYINPSIKNLLELNFPIFVEISTNLESMTASFECQYFTDKDSQLNELRKVGFILNEKEGAIPYLSLKFASK